MEMLSFNYCHCRFLFDWSLVCAILTCVSLFDRSITICSDSQVVLKSIAAAKMTSHLVWETAMTLQQLSMHNCVRLLWVLGHSNIDGNETADELAKQAALMEYVGPEPALGLSLMNIKYEIFQWSVQEQNKRWRNIKSCRQAKQFMQAVNIRLTQYAVRLSRKDLRLLVGLLTGHNILHRHLTLLRRMDDPVCPLGGEEEDTSLHHLGNCCAIAEKRYEFFGRHFLGPGDLRQEHWSILLRFTKTCRRFFITLGLIQGCALGPLAASALGGKTPAPNGKVR